jgi:hypothetical protein
MTLESWDPVMALDPAPELVPREPDPGPGRRWAICDSCDDWVRVCDRCRRCKDCGCGRHG